MNKAVLAALIISGREFSAAALTFIGLAVVGYIITGLGIYPIVMRRKYNP